MAQKIHCNFIGKFFGKTSTCVMIWLLAKLSLHIDFVERIIKPISLCDRNKTAEVHRRVIPQYCLIVMSGWLTRSTVPGASLSKRSTIAGSTRRSTTRKRTCRWRPSTTTRTPSSRCSTSTSNRDTTKHLLLNVSSSWQGVLSRSFVDRITFLSV